MKVTFISQKPPCFVERGNTHMPVDLAQQCAFKALNFHYSQLDTINEKFDVKAFSRGDALDIRTKEDIDNSTFENMIKFIEDKGYTVNKEQSRSDFEHESGERYYYPRIKFSK